MGTSPNAGEAGPVPGARLAEEARLLLDALAERAQPWLNRLAAGEPDADGTPHTPATCGWCPVCAGMALVRGERPELAVRAAEHAAGLLSVLRAALADPSAPDAQTPDAEPNAAETEEEPEPGRVQKIEVRRRTGDERDQ